jgi:uncharacterized protein (TIGR00255 family)
MTAFGRLQKEHPPYTVLVEVRTLNSKSLDVVLRLPKNCLEFEDPLRKLVAKQVRRGRIEVYIQVDSRSAEQRGPRISTELARFYWTQLQELHRALPGCEPPKLDHLLSIPHIFEQASQTPDNELLGNLLSSTLSEALEQIRKMRDVEGQSLMEDCAERLRLLRDAAAIVDSRKALVIEEYHSRIRDRIQELLGDAMPDENRILQEVATYAEKADITEELVRLASHIRQIEEMFSAREPAEGRRLDFLAQELHREANTIGCKSGDLDTIQAVVRMKSEIGKLKEQIQNVE